MQYIIRQMLPQEYPLLENFLYEAIFIPDGAMPPPREILADPHLQIYIDRFGTMKDDWALAAEADGKIVGAAWIRIIKDYGHLDDETPSLAISLYKDYRGQGIGTSLLKEMLAFLAARGYKQVSLSVQKANYAVRLYQKLGFAIVRENEEEWIMRCVL